MAMKISTVGHFFREALISLWRNGWMSLASISTVAISLMILGASMLVVTNTSFLAITIESDVEIAAYLDLDLKRDRVKELGQEIADIPGVEEITLVTKEEALEDLRRQFKDNDILQNLDGKNPLPDYYRIKAEKPEDVVPIAKEIEKFDGVEKVRYGQEFIDKLFALTRWIKAAGITVMVFIGAAAVFLISTTIRLTVFARRREIQIMKFVGASDWFIRWPFLLEGVFLGLLGASVALGVLSLSYGTLAKNLQASLPFLPLRADKQVMMQLAQVLMLSGMGLGALGSTISLRRFLRV